MLYFKYTLQLIVKMNRQYQGYAVFLVLVEESVCNIIETNCQITVSINMFLADIMQAILSAPTNTHLPNLSYTYTVSMNASLRCV